MPPMSARTAGRTAGGKRQCEYEGSHAPALCDQPEFVAALERGRRQRSGGTGPPWALRKFFVTTTLLVSLVMSAEAFSSVPAISRCRWPAAPSSVLPSSDGTNEYMGRHCPAVWRGRWQIGVRNSRTTHAADSHGRRASLLVHFGIPKMFRWLTDQYPNINRRLSEGLKDGTVVDNFYLDMNGIIHPCTHGNSGDIVVLDETEMFKKIFCYVDRLYKLVKPRKVLYLAVDGVAPRAKMNQQRSRRFRSAKDAEELAAAIVARDGKLPEGKAFDSNCITPGTDFMLKLSLAMSKWIEFKQKNDPFWMSGATVIFTGPNVPGEGEHKVMDYIREYQKSPDYMPNTQHVLYGLDADLIMLGLVTHEPRFMLLREKMSVVLAGRRGRGKKKDMLQYQRDDFELLELSALRDMFRIQFRKFADTGQSASDKLLNVQYDVNRIIDDFVFMCMMVGNDFLPHCPHLDIDGGALSLVLSIYVDILPSWKGYLTDKGRIHLLRFEEFVFHVAFYEEEYFKRRSHEENEVGYVGPVKVGELKGVFYENNLALDGHVNGKSPRSTGAKNGRQTVKKGGLKGGGQHTSMSYRDFYYKTKLNITAYDERREMVRHYLEGLHWVLHYYHYGCPSWNWFFPHLYAPLATDLVNLSEFYDVEKSNAASDESPQALSRGATETRAVIPVPVDTAAVGFKTLEFQECDPFPSLAQLLSVLPPQSADLLPDQLSELMLSESSPLASYYPREFKSDLNGKRQTWEAVVDIPFIDSDILLETVNLVLVDDTEGRGLSNSERRRNAPGESKVFVPPHGKFLSSGSKNASSAGSFKEILNGDLRVNRREEKEEMMHKERRKPGRS